MSTILRTSPVEQLSSPCKKGSETAVVERDAGFCSGGDEEDLEGEDDSHSRTDASDESIESKTDHKNNSFRLKNKRKCAEPKKFPIDDESTPYKKRRHLTCVDQKNNPSPIDGETRSPATSLSDDTLISNSRSSPSPFRPWSQQHIQLSQEQILQQVMRCPSTSIPISSPPLIPRPPSLPLQRSYTNSPITPLGYPNRMIISHPHVTQYVSHIPEYDRVPVIYHQDEPLSLVLKDSKKADAEDRGQKTNGVNKDNSSQYLTKLNNECVQNKFRAETTTKPDDRRCLPPSQSMLNRDGPILPQVLTRPMNEPVVKRPVSDARPKFKCETPSLPVSPNSGSVRVRTLSEMMPDEVNKTALDFSSSPSRTKFSVESLLGEQRAMATATGDKDQGPSTSRHKQPPPPSTSSAAQGIAQRNYKNMTRERRIEANARERTRVHTISAAFDTLRRSIPAYSHNQKLSKLSVLRIACSYILTLSRICGEDYSRDQSEPSLAECVDLVTRTIQTEGKLRRKKED